MSHLPVRERLFALTILAILLFLVTIAHLHDSSGLFEEEIVLQISGAVERPGSYRFAHKATLLELQKKAGSHKGANWQNIKNKLYDFPQNQLLIAPAGHKSVYLRGAVQKEGWVILNENARIKDLKELNLTSQEADPHFLKRKRLLKNQEEVIVPSLNQK